MQKTFSGTFTKMDLMKALYTEQELRNVDTSFPIDFMHDGTVDNQMWFVMDYNQDTIFGRLTDLRVRAAEQKVWVKIPVRIGDTVTMKTGHSEVCCYMGVAGKQMRVKLLEGGLAQLFEMDGTSFSFPILASEAGFYRDSEGWYYNTY